MIRRPVFKIAATTATPVPCQSSFRLVIELCSLNVAFYVDQVKNNNAIFAQPPTCIRSSKYLVPQTPGDNGFRITVEGSFKTYVPGRTYKRNVQF